MKTVNIISEHSAGGYVAYPLGLNGVVVGQGDTNEEAVADCKSAIRFHIETFGDDALEDDSEVIETFLTQELL